MAKTEVRRHLDALSHNKEGHLLLGASSLNTCKWSGSLNYFEQADNAPAAPTASAQLESSTTDLSWTLDCDRIIACSDNGSVSLWKLSPLKNSFTCLSQRTEHDDIVSRLAINCDGSKFVTTSYDRSIKVWESEEFVPTSQYTAHHDTVWDAAFHPSHPDIFVSCSQDGQMLLWDLRKLKPAKVIDCKWLSSLPTCVAWQPNTEYKFAVGTETGQIVLHDIQAEDSQHVMVPAHSRLVYRIAFAPHQWNRLASVSHDCTVAVTEFESGNGSVIYRDWSHKDYVQGLSWNPVNNFLTTCSWDNKVISRKVLDGMPDVHRNSSLAMDTDSIRTLCQSVVHFV